MTAIVRVAEDLRSANVSRPRLPWQPDVHPRENLIPRRPHGTMRSSIHEEKMELTAVYIQVPEGYIAFVEELPGANTQGDTLEEARENLREAVAMVLDANRQSAERELAGKSVVREPF